MTVPPLTALACLLATRLTSAVSGLVQKCCCFLTELLKRHRDRWQHDLSYRRTLMTAGAAVVSTVLPHPAVSAAIAAVFADLITSRTPLRPPTRQWDDDYDPHYPFDGLG